ncbi:hypothetical protein HGM15179_006170 [Zosterops borbonicus]|uniref:Uncharacterized protein n=1 Tax=Zosterops borbonicus TaxID=364589 RepID=A0A8K1LNZ2_9PASS|nr:hypothetical protein HGM15179_006170 [Zosterops borbonicus]
MLNFSTKERVTAWTERRGEERRGEERRGEERRGEERRGEERRGEERILLCPGFFTLKGENDGDSDQDMT